MTKSYCPRCDREYNTPEEIQAHLEKHEDFNPDLHGENPREENDSGPAEPIGYSKP